jgi:pimeloyl-ACP methyl ester carboxylesterase
MPELHAIFRSRAEPKLTLVFIHGSGGNYLRTWGPSKLEANWIYWLGRDLRAVDVYSVQHEANLFSFSDYGTISEYASTIGYSIDQTLRSRRVIFVCHSLGGTIAKRMITLAANGSIPFSLDHRRIDLCFIATPHLGLGYRLLAYMPNGIASAIFGANTEIQRANEEFLAVPHETIDRILCFGERRRFIGFRLFQNETAFLNDTRSINLPISKDHKRVCKIQNKNDVIYQSILRLGRARLKGQTVISEEEIFIAPDTLDRLFDSDP